MGKTFPKEEMKRKGKDMKKILLWALVSLIPLSVWCDEGMWMLNRIDQKTADAMQA